MKLAKIFSLYFFRYPWRYTNLSRCTLVNLSIMYTNLLNFNTCTPCHTILAATVKKNQYGILSSILEKVCKLKYNNYSRYLPCALFAKLEITFFILWCFLHFNFSMKVRWEDVYSYMKSGLRLVQILRFKPVSASSGSSNWVGGDCRIGF